jgi:hypothetical protein
VATVVAIVFVAWIAWWLTSLLRHDGQRDRFGTVQVPGAALLELPAGEVSVSYFERGVDLGDSTLDVPADLRVVVSPAGGAGGRTLELRDPGLATEEWVNSDGTGRRMAEADVPEDGRYRVVVSGAGGRKNPEVHFGPSTAFLGTPAGIGLLIGIGVIVLGAVAWAVSLLRDAMPGRVG